VLRVFPMSRRHLAAFALLVLAFSGCGHAFVFPPAVTWTIDTRGGSAFSTNVTPTGVGGVGGNISAFTRTDVFFFNETMGVGLQGAVGSPPTLGTELTNPMITAGVPIAGNVLVSGTLQIASGTNPATITTNTGDVVIRGSLIAERSAGATTNAISINASAGTIYVLGSIIARGTAGTPDNQHGGDVTLTAQRIVITGTIDTGGLSRPASTGGNGGAVMLDTGIVPSTTILVLDGVIRTPGGAGQTQGGNGGSVTIRTSGAELFGPVHTEGGSANVPGTTPTGGNGGNLTFSVGGIRTGSEISLSGGSSTGFIDGAVGGNGGTLVVDQPANCEFGGSITSRGGDASAFSTGAGTLTAGSGGALQIGSPGTRPTVVNILGVSCTTRGGAGPAGGGNAGNVTMDSQDGGFIVKGALELQGGDATAATAAGGMGGSISIQTDQVVTAVNMGNHYMNLGAAINCRGGAGFGWGNGGNGGTASLRCGNDMTITGTLATSGGTAGSGGVGGNAGAVSMVIANANRPATGYILATCEIYAEGGLSTGEGGDGGAITLSAFSNLTFAGTLSSSAPSIRGSAANVTLGSTSLEVHLSGVIRATAGVNIDNPATAPASVTITAGAMIGCAALIDVSGALCHQGNSNTPGGDGGLVTIISGPGGVHLESGSQILANGRDSTDGGGGTPGPNGGAGGRVVLTGSSAEIRGSISARGGGTNLAAGGLGGQVVVNTDPDMDGIGGPIQIFAPSVIDVSGGIGFTGGSARNNGGVAPANAAGANLAVVLDADSGLNASPDGPNSGLIMNQGTIIATGSGVLGRGGDIWFDGKSFFGPDITGADSGNQVRTGPGGNGAFFPN
jgi:hypothetical protein